MTVIASRDHVGQGIDMDLFAFLSGFICTAVAVLGLSALVHGLALLLTVPKTRLTTTFAGQLGRTIGCTSLVLVPVVFLGGLIWLRVFGIGRLPRGCAPELLLAGGLFLSALVGLIIQTIRVMLASNEKQLPPSTMSPRWDEKSTRRSDTDGIQPATPDVIIEQPLRHASNPPNG